MNLKERWEKQNNSVKLLLRRLKRHDTFVVATAVVIALLLCGGLIYISTPVVAANARDQVVKKESENNEKTTEKLDELHDRLTNLDEMIVKNQKGIDSYYEKTRKERMEGDKDSDDVSEKVSGLGTNLKDIHTSVSSTESRIENLKELIEKENGNSNEKIKKEFESISSELGNIVNEYENVKNRTKELMDDLNDEVKSGDKQISKESSTRYEELLSKLTVFNEELEKRNDQSVTDLKNDFESLSAELGDKINEKFDSLNSEMNAGMDGVKGYIDEKTAATDAGVESGIAGMKSYFDEKNTSTNDKIGAGMDSIKVYIDEKNTSTNDMIGSGMEGMKGYIDEKTAGINNKLDQVFHRVSNGKKRLASALLTKGVKVSEDATFEEFQRAIEKIPTQMVLNSGETAASIKYDYHYHTAGNGQANGNNVVPVSLRGGCFTTPVYHRHSEACYTTKNIYIYSTTKDVKLLHHVKDYHDGTPVFAYKCEYCGEHFEDTHARHREEASSLEGVKERGGRVEEIRTQRVLGCNKTETTIEGYAPSCGYVHGQVVSAHVVFNGKNSKYNTTVPAINTSRALMLQNNAVSAQRNLINERMMSLIGYDFGTGEPEETDSEEITQTEESTDNNAGDTDNDSGGVTVQEELAGKDEVMEAAINESTEDIVLTGEEPADDSKEEPDKENQVEAAAESVSESTESGPESGFDEDETGGSD